MIRLSMKKTIFQDYEVYDYFSIEQITLPRWVNYYFLEHAQVGLGLLIMLNQVGPFHPGALDIITRVKSLPFFETVFHEYICSLDNRCLESIVKIPLDQQQQQRKNNATVHELFINYYIFFKSIARVF